MKQHEIETRVKQMLLAPPPDEVAPSIARINRLLPKIAGVPLTPIPRLIWLPPGKKAPQIMMVPEGKEEYITRNVDGEVEYDVKRTEYGPSINTRFARRSSDLSKLYVLETTDGDDLPPGVTPIGPELFANIWNAALNPPAMLNRIPYTAEWEHPIEQLVGCCSDVTVSANPYRKMRSTYLTPGGALSMGFYYRNIFGEADQWKSALADLESSGYEVLSIEAPHVRFLTKRELGLECEREDELYFDSESIIVVRNKRRRLIVVIKAGSYPGLSKKMAGKMAAIFAACASGASNIEHSGGGLYHVPGNEHILSADASCTMSGGGKSDMTKIEEPFVYDGDVPYLEVCGRKSRVNEAKVANVIQLFDDITATNLVNGVKWGRDVEARHEMVGSELQFVGIHFQRTDEWRTMDMRTHLFLANLEGEDAVFVNFVPQDAEGIARYKETEPGKLAMLHPVLRARLEGGIRHGRKFTIVPNMLRQEWNEKEQKWEDTANPRMTEITSHIPGKSIDPEALAANGIVPGQAAFKVGINVHGTRAVFEKEKALCMWGVVHMFPNTPRQTINWFRHVITPAKPPSPSIFGSGNEGPCTQGPFHCLRPEELMWKALQTRLFAKAPTFWTASGNIGPKYKVGHRVRQALMHVFANMQPRQLDPNWLLENGYFEEVQDFSYNGEIIPASILGCRATPKFREFIKIVFPDADDVFTDDMFQPEEQGLDTYVRSIKLVLEGQGQQAEPYFNEHGVLARRSPTAIAASLNLIRYGTHEGKGPDDPEVHGIFTEEALRETPEYHAGLDRRVENEIERLQLIKEAARGNSQLLSAVDDELAKVTQSGYRKDLIGSFAALVS